MWGVACGFFVDEHPCLLVVFQIFVCPGTAHVRSKFKTERNAELELLDIIRILLISSIMKIVIISDTHGDHRALGQLEGDILIHCGDLENLFHHDPAAIEEMDNWFGQQNFDHILCIGGNHDLTLEARHRMGQKPFKNAIFLHDEEFIVDGVKFYGSSWVPWLHDHAFYADDRELRDAWAKIPRDVDVLITHTPPAGCLDVSSRGLILGCQYLTNRLKHLNPTLHCFGHVHASTGSLVSGDITYINAANVDGTFKITKPAIEFQYSKHPNKSRKNPWVWFKSKMSLRLFCNKIFGRRTLWNF